MSGDVTILYRNVHTRGDLTWYRIVIPHQGTLQLRYYMQKESGLIGMRNTRHMAIRLPNGQYQKVRITYVPKPGDVFALMAKVG